MAERTVVGVDFSGAKDEGKTWVAKGRLISQDQMTIDLVHPITRNDLAEFLQDALPGTVVALDFPFGLPKAFLESLDIGGPTIRDVWPQITAMSLDEYWDKCKAFGSHPKRICDKLHPVSMSALNSRLVPMTYHGMGMLHSLNEQHPDRWHIPPLVPGTRSNNLVTLLEVMPGALLASIGFDHATVKGYKNAANSEANRDKIINNLSAYLSDNAKLDSDNAKLDISNLRDFRWGFRANDDSLDAVIAAINAALWAKNQTRFQQPEGDSDAAVPKDVLLEGWIYALKPKPKPQPSAPSAPSADK